MSNRAKCPYCKQLIDSDARICPWCRSNLTSWAKSNRKKKGCLALIVIIIFTILLLIGMNNDKKSVSNTNIKTKRVVENETAYSLFGSGYSLSRTMLAGSACKGKKPSFRPQPVGHSGEIST